MTQSELQVQVLTNALQSMSQEVGKYAMDYSVLMAQYERLKQENMQLIERMEKMEQQAKQEETPSE